MFVSAHGAMVSLVEEHCTHKIMTRAREKVLGKDNVSIVDFSI
jgi:hypothetical protein